MPGMFLRIKLEDLEKKDCGYNVKAGLPKSGQDRERY